MGTYLKWENLLTNNCPKCSKTLSSGYSYTIGIIMHDCGFSIHERKMQEIITSRSGINKNYEEIKTRQTD